MNYYFDMETIKLNPYADDGKILTAQIKKEYDNPIVFKEWEGGEYNLIRQLAFVFRKINFEKGKRTYNPVYTYNGKFDFHYLMGRINVLPFDTKEREKLFDLFIHGTKHCDLLQYDSGYFVSLNKLCVEYGIKIESEYNGSHVYALYQCGAYSDIIAHAIDDVNVLHELVTKHGFDYEFQRKKTLKNYWGGINEKIK